MRKDKKGIIASTREIFALRAEKTADCASRGKIISIRREIIARRRGIIARRRGIIANRREIVASNRDIFASRPNVKGDYPQLVAGGDGVGGGGQSPQQARVPRPLRPLRRRGQLGGRPRVPRRVRGRVRTLR